MEGVSSEMQECCVDEKWMFLLCGSSVCSVVVVVQKRQLMMEETSADDSLLPAITLLGKHNKRFVFLYTVYNNASRI